MSLIDNASLLLTPNAYKEGKLYSVIPSNGNGDFTATRATTATRVNSAGLVDLVPYNLLRYSEMFADAAWTKASSTIAANTITAPDGSLTADTFTGDGTSNTHILVQSVSVTSGLAYTLSCYVKKDTNDFVQLTFNNFFGVNAFANFNVNTGVVGSIGSAATAAIQSVGNGWYRCSVTATATSTATGNIPALFLVNSASAPFSQNNSLSTSVFVWGAQLVEGTSARDYLRTETRLNIPRIDYSLGGCPNILLEPQRTNLALQSSSFDSATWTKGASSVTANSTTSPSGVVDADTFTGDGTNAQHQIHQSTTITSGLTYTTSIYAKKNTNNFIQIYNLSSFFGSNVWANFDLNNGVVGSVGSSTTASIQNVGNGWYRCTITGTAISSGASSYSFFHLVTSATSLRGETNTLSTSVFLWGAQLEAGAYATSYIPTTTASVTRNADSITRNNIFTNGLITAAGGTWFVELRNNVDLIRAGSSGGIFINTGTVALGGSGFLFRNPTSSSQKISIVKYISGTALTLYDTLTTNVKAAIKWNGSTADVFVNGVKEVSATAFSITAMENLIAEGNNRNLHINEMALFPTPLTDAQCLALTA